MALQPGQYFITTYSGANATPQIVGTVDEGSIDVPIGTRRIGAVLIGRATGQSFVWNLERDPAGGYEMRCRGGRSYQSGDILVAPKLDNQLPLPGGEGGRWSLRPVDTGRFFIRSADSEAGLFWSIPKDAPLAADSKSAPSVELRTLSSEYIQIFEFRRVSVRGN